MNGMPRAHRRPGVPNTQIALIIHSDPFVLV